VERFKNLVALVTDPSDQPDWILQTWMLHLIGNDCCSLGAVGFRTWRALGEHWDNIPADSHPTTVKLTLVSIGDSVDKAVKAVAFCDNFTGTIYLCSLIIILMQLGAVR
jgi:hypothetical protein